MGYVRGYGSSTADIEDVADTTIVAAGIECVFYGIQPAIDASSNDAQISIRTAAGVVIHNYGGSSATQGVDLTLAANQRDGIGARPYGINSKDGLRVVVTDHSALGYHFNVCYREVG